MGPEVQSTTGPVPVAPMPIHVQEDASPPADRFQLGLDLLQAVSDQPSVSLDLSLTGASGADAAAQTL